MSSPKIGTDAFFKSDVNVENKLENFINVGVLAIRELYKRRGISN